jgi:hypothetical protein
MVPGKKRRRRRVGRGTTTEAAGRSQYCCRHTCETRRGRTRLQVKPHLQEVEPRTL